LIRVGDGQEEVATVSTNHVVCILNLVEEPILGAEEMGKGKVEVNEAEPAHGEPHLGADVASTP
jgi:hypothetical protein